MSDAPEIAYRQDLDRAAVKRQFERDGFVLLPAFASSAEVALLLRHGLAAREARLQELRGQGKQKTPPGFQLAVKGLDRLSPWLARQTFSGPHLPLLEQLLGDKLRPATTALVDRPPGSMEGIRPHIDGAGRPWHDRCGITLWIALDSMDEENGCLHYVRGSHRRRHAQGLDIPGYDETSPDAVRVEVAPGDAIIHHALTVHWSGGNPSPRPRRAITFFCFGASANHSPPEGEYSAARA